MPERQLSDFAGADHKDRFVTEMVEDLADILDSSARNGDVALAEAGLTADPARHARCSLEQRVEKRPHGRSGLREFIRPFDLSGYLRFADDHAVQARDYAKQMANGLRIMKLVKMTCQYRPIQMVAFGEEFRHQFRVRRVDRAGSRQVQFDAVASGNDNRFTIVAAVEFFQGQRKFRLVKSQAFTKLQRTVAVIATDCQ